MEEMPTHAQRMMRLFAGFSGAYGTYRPDNAPPGVSGVKVEIKSTARTVRTPVSEALWEEHLAGRTPLGIIPTDEENMCWWGCIDVDKYSLDHARITADIEAAGLPLVVCRSKSGGAHLFLFLRERAPASLLQMRLRDHAARLGYGDCEVFPKQSRVLLERGDLGNWLNMPYFGDTRMAVKRTGAEMSLPEFISHAEGRRMVLSEADAVAGVAEQPDTEFGDGPPCLVHLSQSGVPEGHRNNGLFSFGVYARKKHPNDWEARLEDYNRRHVRPPLSSEEVIGVIRSLNKKEYNYKCSDPPIVSHCNAAVCRTRRFGVGDPSTFPILSSLSVLRVDPPLWFMDIMGHRIEMTTDDLQNYKKFHKICMDRLHHVFRSMSQDAWFKMVGAVMLNVTTIDAPPELGTAGQFLELLEDFCTNMQRGRQQSDILLGRPWFDEDRERHYFRLRDLSAFMERHNFILSRGQMAQRIKDLGGGADFFNIKGKGARVWWVPATAVQESPVLDLPSPPATPF